MRTANACEKQTAGLLQRRYVHIDLIRYIGKESNRLEDVDAGLIHSEHGVYTEYIDAARDEWGGEVATSLERGPAPRSDCENRHVEKGRC